MARQQRRRKVIETVYCIEGEAKFGGYPQQISEHIAAYSPRQALWRLARKLEKIHKTSIYLGDCDIFEARDLAPTALDPQLHLKLRYQRQ